MIYRLRAADGGGLAVHRLVFRRLTRTSPNLDVFEARGLMVSFGLMFLVQNFAQMLWGGDLRGYDFLTEPVHRLRPVRRQQAAAAFALALAFSAALIVRLNKTLYGKGVRALMHVAHRAQLVGIDTERLHPLMFISRPRALRRDRLPAVDDLHDLAEHGRAPYGDGADRHHAGRFRQHERALVGGWRWASSRRSACISPARRWRCFVLRHLHRRAAVAPNGLFTRK